jgi:SAM-dependent methyltransferase
MNPAEYERMHALEDWYWWFVARRRAAARFLRDYAPPDRPLRILDAGCGTGGMLDLYRSWPDAEAVGVDLSPDALAFTHGRGHERLARADLMLLPFRSGTFDVVTALDVIEHVSDDARAVQEISRVLRPGGILVASVPAYQFLWGPHDEALHHYRRYQAAEFAKVVQQSGLLVERQTYLLAALFPIAALMRLATRRSKPQEAGATVPHVPGIVNGALIGLQSVELALARQVSLPFGLSVLVVARKPVPSRVKLAVPEEGVPVPIARW